MSEPRQTHLIRISRVDYRCDTDRAALTALLDHYARDPMGGNSPLDQLALARLCDDLAERYFAFSFLAWSVKPDGEQAVGLINCFEGYSTFKAQALINIHDVIVHRNWRGAGIGQQMLAAAEKEAIARKACKITLEVLTGNGTAMRSYERFGFAPYVLNPSAGTASFMQKWLS